MQQNDDLFRDHFCQGTSSICEGFSGNALLWRINIFSSIVTRNKIFTLGFDNLKSFSLKMNCNFLTTMCEKGYYNP